tara:strand:- start:127983 stop:143453 length:15471 start_codon:yes stop_codon:yes gene_type:complete
MSFIRFEYLYPNNAYMKNSFSLKLILITLLFFAAGFISYGQTRVKVEVNGSPTACNGTDFSGTYIKRDEDSDGFGIYEHESLDGYEIRRNNKQFWVLANGTTIYNNSPYDGEFPTCGTWTGGSTGDPNNPGFGCFSIEITSGRSGREECSPANTPPSITNIQLSGIPQIGQEITASYTFNDSDDDTESGSTFQWYADDVAINGAISINFTPTANQLGLALKVEITPSDGISFGTAATKEVGIVSCEDGFTCEVQDVSVCDSNIYQVPNGSLVSENGSYESISGTVKTYYNVTFDRTDIVSDVYVNATIAASGSVTYQASTNATGVLSFDKSQDYWVNMNALQDDLDGTNRSVFMWVKSEADVVSDDQTLFAINTASGGNVALFKIDNDGENLELFDGSDNQSASFDMGDGQWHYVGYTYHAATTETVIYVDGIENDRFKDNQSTANDSQYSLGQEFDNANDSDHMNGDMAEISIWNEVLNGAEIRESMQAKINNGHPKYANLVGYYSVFGDCDDDTAVLKDHSGKGNDGVMMNSFIVDFKNVQSVTGFNAIDWYENISWKKDGSEVSTAPAYTFDVATGSYEFIATRSFIQSSDSWTLTTNTNATTVDLIADETLCSDDAITKAVGANTVNYLDFEETESNYIEVNSLADDLAGTSRSIFMWVNKESNVASGDVDQLLSIMSDDGFNAVTNLYINASEKVTLWDGNNSYASSTTITNDTWYYVGYTYDASTFEGKIYINGVEEETFTKEMPVSAGNLVSLGQRYEENGTGGYLDGKLAEITVWNKVLSEEEVNALMAVAPAHNAANLVASYGTFKNIVDNRLLDLTANGNDGLASHNSIFVTTEEAELTDYDATNNYIFSWKKEGTEFDTDATGNITIDEGTTNYSVTYGTPLFQRTDEFSLSYTNLIPTQPSDLTAGVTGSVTFSVQEVEGATYQWFEKNLEVEAEDFGNGEQGFPQAPGLISDILVDDSKLYISTRGGLAVSTDEGQTWATLDQSSGLVNNIIAGFAVDGDKYFVGHGNNGGLSVSLDAGQNWSNITARDNGFANSNNPQFVTIIGRTLYVATDNGISISSDDGQTFTTITTNQNGFPDTRKVNDIFGDGNKIYAATDGGITVSEDGGINWQSTVPGEDGFPAGEKALSVYANGDNIYVGTQTSGLVISRDGGETWTNTAILLDGYPDSETVRTLISVDGNLYAGTNDGLFLSQDQGATWTILLENKLIFGLAGNSAAIYAGDNSGNLYRFNTLVELSANEQAEQSGSSNSGVTTRELTLSDLTLDQDQLQYYVVVSKDGCDQQSDDVTLTVLDVPIVYYISPSDGKTDVKINTGLLMEFSRNVSRGTGNLEIFNYANDELVQTFSSAELSIDGSLVWLSPEITLDYATQYYVTLDAGIVVDGSNAGNLAITDKDFWSFHTECEPLVLTQPEDETGYLGQSATFSVPEVDGASYQWFEKGEDAWNTLPSGQDGFPNTANINTIFVEGDKLYAGTGAGLAISTDGGSNWTTTERDQNGFGTSSVVNSVYAQGDNIYVGTTAGISISTDGGNSWTATGRGENGFSVANALAGNVVEVNSVFAGGNTVYAGMAEGISISTDGGANWTTTQSGVNGFANGSVLSIYADGDKVYAGTFNGGLSISTDGGVNWNTISPNPNNNTIPAVFAEGDMVYVGTSGGGASISSDGGLNWRTVNRFENGFSGGFDHYSVYAEGEMVYVGTNSGLSISSDGGFNWETTTANTNGFANSSQVNSVFAQSGQIFAGTTAGISIFGNITLSNSQGESISNFIAGANTRELTISNLTEDFDQTEYFVVVTKGDCEETSDSVTLSVTCEPIVLNAPSDQTVVIGGNAALSVSERAGASYQWYSIDPSVELNIDLAVQIEGSVSLLTKYDGKFYAHVRDVGLYIVDGADVQFIDREVFANGNTSQLSFSSMIVDESGIFIIAGNYGFYKSVDGGATWSLLPKNGNATERKGLPSGIYKYLQKSGSQLYLTTKNKIYTSSDLGESWTLFYEYNGDTEDTAGSANEFFAFALSDNRMALTTRKSVLVSIDGGISWSKNARVSPDQTSSTRVALVEFGDSGVFLRSPDGFYKSDDMGANWVKISLGGSTSGKASAFLKTSNGLLLVHDGSEAYLSTEGDKWHKLGLVSLGESFTRDFIENPDGSISFLTSKKKLYDFIPSRILTDNDNANNKIQGATTNQLTLSALTEDLNETVYFVEVSGIECAGFSNTGTISVTEAPADPPVITALSPADDEIDVAGAAVPTITFDKAIEKGTGNIEVRSSSDDQLLTTIGANSNAVNISNNTATISLGGANFEFGTDYYIIIPEAGFTSTDGGIFEGITDKTAWSFTIIDATSVEIDSFFPESGATGVSAELNSSGNNFQINFEEAVSVETTAQSGLIQIYNASNDELLGANTIPGTGTYFANLSNENKTLNVAFIKTTADGGVQLVDGQEYYILITDNHISRAGDGAPYTISNPTVWSFTVGEAADPTFTHTSFSPTNGAVEVETDILLNPTFNSVIIDNPLRINFGGLIGAGTSGTVGIYKASDDSPVVEYDLATETIGSIQVFNGQASGGDQLKNITIVENLDFAGPMETLRSGALYISSADLTLENNTEYYVLIDRGAIVNKDDASIVYEGISDKTAWNFTTKALDAEPLEVSSTFPSATRDALLDFPYINLTFGETTAAGSGAITIYRADDNSVFETIDVSEFTFSNGGTPKRVQVPLTNGWEVGTAYYIQYPAGLITSLDGSKEIEEINDKTSFAFKAESFNENIITSFFPATGSTTYVADSEDDLVIYTSVGVALERDPLGSFRIYKAANDELVKTIEYDGENERDLDYGDDEGYIKFEFDDDELEPGTEYYVLVDDGFIISYEEGLYHVGISDPTTWRFTTLEEPTTPTLFSINPGPNATDVPVSANIALNYSENVQANPHAVNNVVLYDASDNVIETFPANTLNYSGVKVTLNPTNDLAYSTTYYVLAEDEAFISNNGVKTEAITNSALIRFTTESQPNTAPAASNVAFTGSLEANQQLTGNYDYSDVDTDAESGSTLQWYVADDASGANRAAISGATSSNFTLTSSEVGKFITFRVIPNDGSDAGSQAFATYAGPVVAAVVPTIVSTVPADGTVDLAKDANLSFVLSESVTKGTGNITLTPVTGSATVIDVTSAEVTVSGTNVSIDPSTDLLEGQFYTVTFDAAAFVDADGNNSAGLTSQTTWNFTVKEANVAPVAQGVSIKKSLVVDGVLEGSYTYSDANDDAESGTTFQWYRADDTSGTNRAAISGASSQTYTVVNDDNGKYVSFEVTPNDGVLTGTAKQGAYFGPIVINDGFTNIAPAFTSDAVTSVKDNETYTYSITYEDLNNDVPILSKEVGPIWLTVNGMVISGNPSSADVGDHKIILELVDQFDDKAYQEFTLTVVASNTAPIVNGLEITGTTIIDDQLTASYNFIDAESHADNSSFKWYRSDDNVGTGKTEINGATSTTYTLVAADAGKFISFEVTPNDGKVNGTLAESAAVGPVIKKTPSLSLSAISKTYGDTDFDLSAATNSSGTITYTFDNDQTGAAINGSTVTLGNVGEIIVNVNLAEDAEYAARQVQGAIMVGKKALELTATNTNKNVGETDPTLQFTVTTGSIVGNDEVVTVSRDVGEAPGTYAVTFSNGVAAGNYNITTNPGVFTINKALLTITADAATKTYGAADPAFTYSITNGSLNSGDVLNGAVTRVSGEGVGTYALESNLFNPSYTLTFVSADLTVEKTVLTATADDLSKYLGETNPELTISYSGFANGDTKADITEPTIATTATESSPVGTYAITLSRGAASNYNLSLVNGTLTVEQRPFVITIDAQYSVSREIEVLGVIEGLTYDYTVDWGDGNIDTNLTEAAKHTYTSAGPFTVKVTGNYPGLQLKYFNIKSIEQWGSQEWESLENAFQNRDLTINATDVPDLTQGPSMAGMFASAKIGSPDLTAWDVSMVTNMSDIFNGSDFNGDVSTWNVSNVTDMSGAFGGTPFNGDISTWNVGNVTTMRSMFIQATDFNGDLSNWDVTNVTNMESVFNNADAFNGDISSWDVSSVTDMTGMFSEADLFNQDISSWDVSNVVDMAAMFSGTKVFNQPLDAWDVSNVTTMEVMFRNADAFNQDLNSWDVSKVEKFDEMFKQTALFNGDITGWDVSSGQDFEEMFQESESFNQPIGNWNLASATRVRRMFRDAEVFNQPINDWRFPNLESLEQMFWGALVFNQDLNDWDVSNITNMASTFEEAESFNGNISNWDVNKVEDFDEFMNETPFNQDISGWNVSNAKDFGRMFEDSPNFNQDLSNWDMSKATDVAYMFESATSFDQDISSWQLTSVTSFGSMLKNSGLSVENYDAFLISLSQQELITDVQFDVEGLQYCAGTAARQSLIDNLNWTIENDTQGCSVTVTIADVSANEDDGTITVTLTSNAFVVGGFTVDVSTADGTAEARTDYTAVTSQTITFAGTVGETQTFTITLTADTDVEVNETLTVSMDNLVTGANNTVTITDEATITILNDDVPVVSFNTTAQSNAESVTSSSIVVNLDQAGLSAATVEYTVTGTATGSGVDYMLANGTLSFATGELSKTIGLTIVDDAMIEENETVVITLSNASGASLGTNTVYTYTIVNNDAQVTIEDVSQFEDGESFLVTATLEGTIEGGFTVDLSTADGTAAVADGDYTAVSGTTLTFSGTDGEVQKLDIAPGVDSKLEADETFIVSLSNLVGTTANVVIIDQAVLTIKNDDAAAVTLVDVSGNEGDGAITVTATLDNAVQGGFTVEVNTADGTATLADSDYAAVAGKMLTFAGTAGETQTFTLVPTDDSIIEANETLIVSMSKLSTALGVDISDGATVTIVNDDFNNFPTDITLSTTSIAENNALDAVIGTLTTTDADAGNTHTYALVSGAGDTDNASFTLEGSTLKANNTSFNFEDKASYSVRIETNDGEGGTFVKAFEITVTNVNEAPFTLSLTNATIEEADDAQEVGLLMSLDPDNGDIFTYSLVAGAGDDDNAQFAISGNTLSTAGAIDFEDGASRSIRVQVADAGGLTFEQTFSITIEDVVAEPVREYTQNQPGADVKNVFSPNGDGVNETWVIEDLLDNPFNQVKIFAQGGKLIYSKVNYSNDWSGTFKDNPVPDGTYYYEIVIYADAQSTTPARTIKGFLTIIRNR